MMGIRIAPRQVQFPAMGTTVSVLFAGDLPTDAIADVRDLFAEWEATLSRFRADSELSRLNAADGRAMQAGPLLMHVATTAFDAARATEGAFDPTLGRHMVAIGYEHSFGEVLRAASRPATPLSPRAGWRDVDVDEANGTIRLPAGVALDLGGIAKGMAVDAAAGILAKRGTHAGLVNAGGDMRVVADGAAEWTIGITEAPGQAVALLSGGLATSSVTKRSWVQGGRRRHHLIDPQTGQPARSDVRSVTVAATTCAQAEVAAKTALVLGADLGAAFLTRRGLAALLTLQTGSTVSVSGWPSRVAA
jgi:FAD:protein FMN transferase